MKSSEELIDGRGCRHNIDNSTFFQWSCFSDKSISMLAVFLNYNCLRLGLPVDHERSPLTCLPSETFTTITQLGGSARLNPSTQFPHALVLHLSLSACLRKTHYRDGV